MMASDAENDPKETEEPASAQIVSVKKRTNKFNNPATASQKKDFQSSSVNRILSPSAKPPGQILFVNQQNSSEPRPP